MSNKHPIKPPEAIQQHRRNLIKASAAVPFIASLVPNAASAMSSVTCQGGDFSAKKLETNGNSVNGDNAVRIAVAAWGDNYNNAKIYRLPSTFGGTPDLTPTISLGETLWHHNYSMVNGQDFVVEPQHIAADGSETPEGFPHFNIAHVLVLYSVAPDGTINGLGYFPQYRPGDGITALTGSCLTSIAMSDNQIQI